MSDATDRADSRDTIRDVRQLDDRLSEPTPEVIDTLGRLGGDLIVLGVAGKMGPTLARMARRAFDAAGVSHRVIGVARFSTAGVEDSLREHGVETVRCDLLDPEQLARLPDVPNVLYLSGMKFGSTGREAQTWGVNAYLPGMVSRRFPGSRVVALSTGNVYGPTPVARGGSREADPLAPQGEYAMSCLGRERIFEYFSRALGIPMVLVRLNYATEMRYGVLVDLAQKVLAGEPIDLAIGHFNAIWQGDASAFTLRAFDLAASPPLVMNLSGPDLLSVRALAEQFGALLGKAATFRGTEGPDALLSDTTAMRGRFGAPRVDTATLVRWTADWVRRGGPTLGKPTGYEVRDGRF